MSEETITDIRENLRQVRDHMAEHCAAAGRSLSDVTLIAVSKTKPVSMMREAYDAGIRDFGENRVQEILEKYDQMPSDVRWHLIGHLQTNKVKYIVDKVEMIHSVDSVHLAEAISKEAVKKGLRVKILVQVNVAGEETKFGVAPEDAERLVETIRALPGLQIEGLMTVAPYVEDQEDNRDIFAKLCKVILDIREKNHDNINMHVLSMGMTGDYGVAIEEGSTMIRVGTGIFGARNYRIKG